METETSKIDKRKETSKANMEKARKKILEQRRTQKAERQFKEAFEYAIDDSDSSDSSSSGSGSSSDDEPVIKIKTVKKDKQKKKEGIHEDNLKNEIKNLKMMMAQMAQSNLKQKKKKKKDDKKPKQNIIQIVPPTKQTITEPKQIGDGLEQHLKRKILNF